MGDNYKQKKILFLACWAVYFCVYVGRLNYSAAMVWLIDAGLLTKTEAGLVASCFFFAYGFSQVFAGHIGDRVSPFKMIFVGAAASSLCNFSMAFFANTFALCVFWGLNGVAQSIIWAPIIRIISQILPPEARFKASVNIVASVPAGTIFTYFLSTFLLKYFDWKSVFYSAGAILAAISVAWLIYTALNKKHFVTKAKSEKFAKKTPGKLGKGEKKLLVEIALILAFPVLLHGMLKDSVATWFPVFLTESHDISPIFAVLVTVLLPVANIFGIFAAKYVLVKLKKNELLACSFFFSTCAAGLALMFALGRYSLFAAAALAAVATASMTGANVVLISVLPTYFGNIGLASTVTGILNSLIYAGSAISMSSSGKIVERFGWGVIAAAWCFFAGAGLVLCFVLAKSWLAKKSGL
ncbi:MAG: MFS transporter [Oscillospiraceae bacterium]|nr:MFS transporter [Oscillospiraceae bacterium]